MEYKSASSIYEFVVTWTTELGGDLIVTSSWAAETGITIDSDSKTTATTTVWLSGGTAGKTYKLTNTIVSATRTYEQTFFIRVQAQLI